MTFFYTMNSDLIVDFPNSRTISKKTVQFSLTSSMVIVSRVDEDANDVWYTSKDYKGMRLATKLAVLRAQKKLLSISTSDLESMEDPDEMGDAIVTGIENLLTPNIIRRTKARRNQCIQTVLQEQESQYRRRKFDPESLAHASYHHSRTAERNAWTIGLLTQSR